MLLFFPSSSTGTSTLERVGGRNKGEGEGGLFRALRRLMRKVRGAGKVRSLLLWHAPLPCFPHTRYTFISSRVRECMLINRLYAFPPPSRTTGDSTLENRIQESSLPSSLHLLLLPLPTLLPDFFYLHVLFFQVNLLPLQL